jgi:hypothetical protein
MTKNVGRTDKLIRLVAVAAIAILLATGTVAVATTLGIILSLVGVIFLFTALVNWCAIYTLFGTSTCPTAEQS